MKAFADLLERLVLTPARNRKLALLVAYLQQAPDPDRGYGIAAITRDLDIKTVQPSILRTLVAERMDPELFKLSYDYVGDLAETIALLWDEIGEPQPPTSIALSEVVETLSQTSRAAAPQAISTMLNALAPSERYALIKLTTGGLRIGVSARLTKQAIAQFGGVDVNEIDELWHGLTPPYESLFAWLEGNADKPVNLARASFRPVMLSHALEERDQKIIAPEEFVAEWKWDGIRIQASSDAGVKRLYTRTGDDISRAFPDIVENLTTDGTFDGELLVRSPLDAPLEISTFSDLQQRLNRKTVSKKMLTDYPAFVRFYDVLLAGDTDVREQPLVERKHVLEKIMHNLTAERFDISPMLSFDTFDDLLRLRASPPSAVIEGLMLKRRQSAYLPGRPRGHWFKWKRDPMRIDAVLMYAQRGHGKRSGYYSDFTFGCWRAGEDGDELVPVGKAYFGFTDEELKKLDRFVRNNTRQRFGPVRSVAASKDEGLVVEVAFDGVNRSTRHKSGIAMRFPRFSSIRWDKPTAEADRLETLENLIG